MRDLGFQACCLLCDAGDEPGLKRCSTCIETHRGVRDKLAAAIPGDSLFQLAKDILEYSANPHRHDHDAIHGPALMEQQRLAALLSEDKPVMTGSEIEDVFKAQAAKSDVNPIRDISNKNPWKDKAPTSDVVKEINQQLSDDSEYHGKRTIPSRKIATVDRSERPGEDHSITDQIAARKISEGLDEEYGELVKAVTMEERRRSREKWGDVVSAIDELIDENSES